MNLITGLLRACTLISINSTEAKIQTRNPAVRDDTPRILAVMASDFFMVV